jgi:hypothetical protein
MSAPGDMHARTRIGVRVVCIEYALHVSLYTIVRYVCMSMRVHYMCAWPV